MIECDFDVSDACDEISPNNNTGIQWVEAG